MNSPIVDPGTGPEPLLSLRAVVILTFAALAGSLVGGLTLWAGAALPVVILAGLSGFGGTVRVLHEAVAKR